MKNRIKAITGLILFFVAALSLHIFSSSIKGPLTAAESSGFTATSSYADVNSFIKDLQRLSPHVRVETLCISTEGRNVPLLVIGDPAPFQPSTLRYDKRGVVYIQANIHAGEVEGKEASLMLARDILLADKRPYLDKLVILIAPIFNADGNEKISQENRRNQAGPEKGVGVRHNGQNLDLNRDSMKLESPELQGLVRNVLTQWDPLLLVDCHTTNGSYHDEPVTYSWPLNPNGDAGIISYMRDKMMPEISTNLKDKYKTLSIPYGNFKDSQEPEKGWETFTPHPRYVTNYIGLRNRLAILNENYVYADYKTRVLGCYHFLRAILDYCYGHLDDIFRIVAEADMRTIQRGLSPKETDGFSVEFEVKPLPNPVTIQSYITEVIPREGTWPQIKKTEIKKTYTVPFFSDISGKRSVRFPYAYLIPVNDVEIIGKLKQHGIMVEKLTEPAELEVEAFKLKELKAAERLYQGHRMNEVKGEYTVEKKAFSAGTLVILTAQPLGNLAACLLEPESDDGFLVWNFFDRYIVPQWGRGFETYPVYKLLAPVHLAKEILN